MMGWSCGYDTTWKRDIGYGVPALCDQPNCNAEIDRGLSYVCGGRPYGGEYGCGLYFCCNHLWMIDRTLDDSEPAVIQLCEPCSDCATPFEAKPDVQEWVDFKLTDESWAEWRKSEGLESVPPS